MLMKDATISEHQPPHFPPNPKAYKWKALATVAMGTLMGTMDASISNIALPVLATVFKAELTTVMWVVLAYILVCSSLILVFGKISDLIGRKRIYAAGMFIFTLGLISCSLAQSIGQLILFRTFQAVGAAMCISCGPAIVTESFPPKEIGRGLGLLGSSISLGFIIGPILGGFLLSWIDWRSIFYIRAPVGLVTLIMAVVLLERDPQKAGKIQLDLKGILTSTAGLFFLIFGVSQAKGFGPKSPLVLLLVGLGVSMLTLFTFVERRVKDPIVDLSLFKNQEFSRAICSLFLFFVAAPSYVLIMPFYLIQGIRLAPADAGLLMAVTSMTSIVVGPISGSLSDRFGPAWFSTLGAGAIVVAAFFIRGFDLQTQVAAVIPVLVLLGVGVGTFNPPNNSIIMGAVPTGHLGTASALIATLRQVGISLGMAFAGTIFTARRTVHQATLTQQGLETDYAANLSIPLAFHDVLLFLIFLGSLVVLLSLFSGRKEGRNASDHPH